MASKKIVVVFGASGAQGGSVARALLQNPSFAVRAVTRDLDGKGAQELKKLKIDVVKGDIDDQESLKKVVAGAYGCFLVTNYWEHLDANRELQQGKNVVDACKATGIKHLVFSGLENTEGSGVAGPVPHFDAKGKIEDYIQKSGISYTSTRLSFYSENFLSFFPPRKIAENKYAVSVPMGNKPLFVISVNDLGPCVAEIFKDPSKYNGKRIGLAGDELTVDQVCAILSKHLKPKQFENTKTSYEDFAKLGFPGAAELAYMFHFYQLKDNLRDVALTKKLNPKVLSFDAWVQANKDKLNQAMK
ncbi:hypothetical protein ACJMK2_019279 [Sinanodonta woodiana]|uniref:NmrA-like family domain-containing protein 1 n=1 Tax=Sinanodonta woodiana TaxID=1069815 RepID=A0ABD3UFW9_SINWO